MNYTEEELNIETEKETEQKKSLLFGMNAFLNNMISALIFCWLFAILFFLPLMKLTVYLIPRTHCI